MTRHADIEGIDATKLTHVNYAFAKVHVDEAVLEDPDAPANLARLVALKRLHPGLKVILSIGGWGAEWFSDAALTPASRCRFATSAVALLRQYQLDGLDIDWEYPGQPGGGNRYRPEDRENFTLLLNELRYELDLLSDGLGRKGSDRYTLTIASSGGRYFDHVDMARIHRDLDWINVMAYDFFGYWPDVTGHHSGLHAAQPHTPSAESFVMQHLAAGVPPDKIVLGVPLYAKWWRWVNRKSDTGIGEPYDLFSGDVSYARLESEFLRDPRYVHGWDRDAREPYLWDPELGTFVSYDDPRSLRDKARFVKRQHLGGMMFWEQSHDPDQVLLDAIYDELHRQ